MNTLSTNFNFQLESSIAQLMLSNFDFCILVQSEGFRIKTIVLVTVYRVAYMKFPAISVEEYCRNTASVAGKVFIVCREMNNIGPGWCVSIRLDV